MFDYASAQIDAPITIDLYESQFIPIDDETSYLGILVNYTANDPSLVDSMINARMQVFASNGTLVKTSSFPDGIRITESGTIVMSTEFTDKQLSSLTVDIVLTNLQKTETLSNTDTATVPFNDEEGQEKLLAKFDRQVQEELQKQEGSSDNREIERIESTSQSDLDITSATTYFDDDYFHIVGEVHNTASEEKEFVKVTATIYGEEDNVIGTDTTYTSPSKISSQESAPFEFILGESDVSDLEDIKKYKIISSGN